MTEERFENVMEQFGNVVEKTVESAATVFDKSMNFAWRYRSVRVIGKTLTFLTGAGLMVSAASLKEKGCHKTARACFISGGLVIAAQIVEIVIFSKKRL